MPQRPSTSTFFQLPWSAGIQEFSLQLVVQWKDEWWHAGTAILIGDKLALSAKHILEFIYTHILGESIPTGIPEFERTGFLFGLPEGCGMNAIQTIDSGQNTLQWSVSGFYRVGYRETDLMLLSLAPHPVISPQTTSYRQIKLPRLWLFPPPIGQLIDVFGFPDHQDHIGGKLPDGSATDYFLYQSKGSVVHINSTLENRQASRVSFSTTAHTHSGMSGGPVAVKNSFLGNVICGVVSSRRAFANESLITPLWPILGTRVFRNDPELGVPGNYSVLELANAGIVNAPSAEHFSLQTIRRQLNPDGSCEETVIDGEQADNIDATELEIQIVCTFPELQRQGTLLGNTDWIDGVSIRILSVSSQGLIRRGAGVCKAESITLVPNSEFLVNPLFSFTIENFADEQNNKP